MYRECFILQGKVAALQQWVDEVDFSCTSDFALFFDVIWQKLRQCFLIY